MKYNDAMSCLGVVVGTTNGWTNEKISSYAKQIATWNNVDALRQACQTIADNWTRASAPPLGSIREAYLQELRRRSMEHPTNVFAIGGRIPTAAQGREIAANAYVQECARLGKEPNWTMFDRIIGQIASN